MSKNKENANCQSKDDFKIRTLTDLIRLNLSTLEDVVKEKVDNRKAALIFTGSRTVTSSIKLGIEAMKLGAKSIGGVDMESLNQIELKTE